MTNNSSIAAEITTVLDGAWHDLRETLRDEVDPQIQLGEPGCTVDQQRERVTNQLRALAARGHGRIGFPHEYGGTHDYGASCAAFEIQAFGDLSLLVKSGVQFGLFGGAVARLGTAQHHETYLRPIMDGELLGSFAMTEVGHGSNVQRLETTAAYDAETDELVIHTPTPSAVKTYIGNAARDAELAVVFAQLMTAEGGHGVHAVLVPVRDQTGATMPGVTIGDNGVKAGLPGVDNGTFAFDQVRVPRTNLLDAYGGIDGSGNYVSTIENENRRFFTMLGTLVRGRVCVGGGSGSAAKKALAIALRYGASRRQFEAPGDQQETVVLDYLAHQRKLLPRLAKSYALSLAQNLVIERLEELQGAEAGDKNQEGQRELETRVAGLKAVQTWHALDTIQTCREACGGAGYMAENQLAQMRADVDVFTTFEGDNTVLLQLCAKGLLTDYKEMWGDLDPRGTARAISRQLAEGMVERTTGRARLQKLLDVAKGRDDDSALDDRGWQLSMFEQRADHSLEGLARRLRRIGDGDAFEVFNKAQDHLLFAARTHIDRVVFEAFAEAVDGMDQGPARALLDQVCSLYALSSIEADRAWFLEHGRINTTRSRAITTQVNDLCQALRPHVDVLVDGMGVPEALITAPIAARRV
ncbi:acyl-CoA dehydrogenase [Demetria terragena]|uniref:acyl-CoA dehydrogenase family protein n=1 Tax=Demetria terragena TaxID=63959 RepID=UPI000372364F|nr:acyl-CoA dehydrogenase [Demetria terragena]